MSEPIYTGKCGQYKCNHAQKSHEKSVGACKVGDTFGQKRCQCPAYEPVIDQEAFNSLDGKPPVELYEYQKQYLQNMPAKYIMAADTGTGKSFMALAHYDKLAYLKPLLVIAPAAKVNTGDWQRDIELYFAGRIVPEYEVYSYEKFSRVPTIAKYRETGEVGIWRDYLAKHSDFAVICDEIHKAKNPQSGIGKRVYEVGSVAKFFIGLSATPLPNGWIDAANYFKTFGLVRNITEFKKRYVREQRYRGFPEIVGYNFEDELQSRWNSMAKPLNKQNALDLPPVTVVPITLEAGSQYGKVKRDRLFKGKVLDNPSSLLHGLRQSIIEPKVAWLNNFLDEASDNVVIFYNYRSERDAILAMLKKSYKGRTVFRQDGEKHEVPDKSDWARLQGSRSITLAQYQSGSTGIELTYAATIVYFSPTYSYSNYEQSIGRINRNGQTRKMTLYMLCAPTTLEREVWTALRNKTDFQTQQWYDENVDEPQTSRVQLKASNAGVSLGDDDVY